LKIGQPADYENQKISELIIDKEYGGTFLRLDNQRVIYHNTFFGSELMIEKYSEVFNEKGDLK